MTTLQELYDVERQKTVKDVALLKRLKPQITEVHAVTAQLQQAESDESWEEYEILLLRLTQLTSSHTYSTLAVASAQINVTSATGKVHVAPIDTETNISDDEFATEPATTSTTSKPTETNYSDDDFEVVPKTTDLTNTPAEESNSDDDFITTATNTVVHHDTIKDLHKGDIFSSVIELQSALEQHAKTHTFKIRREKDSIVCANAGCSNWTGITNYKARAKQALRRKQRHHDDESALLDDSPDNSLQGMLHTEEDKVGPQLTLTLR